MEKIELDEGRCVKCGCALPEARGGAIHTEVCYDCYLQEAEEFEREARKMLKKLALKCPNCRKNMSIIFNYICKCGFKEIQKR